MREISVYRAQPTGPVPVESVRISIEKMIPEHPSLDAARSTYAANAAVIADALVQSLPGGTVDQVLIELLKRKASLFKVPFTDDNKTRVELAIDYLQSGNYEMVQKALRAIK